MMRMCLLLLFCFWLVCHGYSAHATSQTLTIVDTLDDGYQDGSSFNTGLVYFGNTNPGGFSFLATAQITAGSTINSVYIRGFRVADDSGNSAAIIAVENAAPATNTRFSASHLPDAATVFTANNSSAVNWIDYRNQYVFGSGDSLPVNIGSQIQSLLDTYGTINVGHRINVRITATAASYANMQDSEDGTSDPQLIIDWTAGAVSTRFFHRRFP